MESKIETNDHLIDIFDQFKREVALLEQARREHYFRRHSLAKPVADRTYIEIFLRAHNEHRIYKKEGYDILSLFGDLGGLYEIIYFSGWLLTGIFASRLYRASIINEAYLI